MFRKPLLEFPFPFGSFSYFTLNVKQLNILVTWTLYIQVFKSEQIFFFDLNEMQHVEYTSKEINFTFYMEVYLTK